VADHRCGHPLVAADAGALRLMPDVIVDLRKSARSAQQVLRGEAKGGAVRVDDLTAATSSRAGTTSGW
jgi:hypothetical protein